MKTFWRRNVYGHVGRPRPADTGRGPRPRRPAGLRRRLPPCRRGEAWVGAGAVAGTGGGRVGQGGARTGVARGGRRVRGRPARGWPGLGPGARGPGPAGRALPQGEAWRCLRGRDFRLPRARTHTHVSVSSAVFLPLLADVLEKNGKAGFLCGYLLLLVKCKDDPSKNRKRAATVSLIVWQRKLRNMARIAVRY